MNTSIQRSGWFPPMTRRGRIAHTGVYKLLFYYHLILLLCFQGVYSRRSRKTSHTPDTKLSHTQTSTHPHATGVDDDEIIVNRNRLFFYFLPFDHTIPYEIHFAAAPPHEPTTVYVRSNCVVVLFVYRNISCTAAENRPREEIPNVFIMRVIKTGCLCSAARGRGTRASRSQQTEPFIFLSKYE